MASNHISQLVVTGLRGVSQTIELNLVKPLTLVYGENGSGKTSICDALDFLGNGVVGSLADISTSSQKHNYWPFLGTAATGIDIYLELKDGQNWRASATGKIVTVSNENTRPVVKVWRRKQLIDLILAKPAERYNVIKPFIDLSSIENSENKLRELKRQIEASTNSAAQRISENLETIKRLRNDENASGDISWARGQLSIPVENIDDEINQLNATVQSLSTLAHSLETLSTRSQENQTAITQESDARQTYESVKDNFDKTVEETLSVLTAAQGYFHSHSDAETCPLCLSKENIDGLSKDVDKKLKDLSEVKESRNQFTRKKQGLVSAEDRLTAAIETAESAINALQQAIASLEPYPHSVEIASRLVGVGGVAEYDQVALQAIKSRLEERKASLQEGKGARAALQAALNIYDENINSQRQNRGKGPVIDRLLEIHETKRREFIDAILVSIADEVGRLYEEIHPGEGLNRIALQLDPRRRSSLEINSEFLSQQVPPGPYFSNSHLDSLGLCVLIAIAQLEDPENTILVMDDILGSIDEPHVERLVNLLYEESKKFRHCLVTSHYKPWKEKYRLGQLRNGQCQLVELGEWIAESGVQIGISGKYPVDELRDLLAATPVSTQLVCASAGVLLEQICDHLTLLYGCSVPRVKGGYTIGHLLPSIKGKLKQALKAEIKQQDDTFIERELGAIFEELLKIASTRNIFGCHYNELAQHMPDQDAIRFGELVLELGESIICPEEGLPKLSSSGSYWATRNETRRLHPLQKPS